MSPSDALILVVRALLDTERSWKHGRAFIHALNDVASLYSHDDSEEWMLEADELFRTQALTSIAWPPAPAYDVDGLARLIRAAQALDRWHAPLCNPDVYLMPSDEQAVLREHLLDEGRFNSSKDDGALVPQRSAPADDQPRRGIAAWGRRARVRLDEPTPNAAFQRRVLVYTLYLPLELAAGNPAGAGLASDRRIAPRYRVVRSLGASRGTDEPRVAVAPVAESDQDIAFHWASTPEGNRYWMMPSYPAGRLEAVIAEAVHSDAHILFLPEMTTTEADLEVIESALLAARRSYYTGKGRRPPLRYVLAGVTGEAAGRHSNYIAVVDVEGRVVERQHKLTRWDLTDAGLARYGLPAAPPPISGGVCEDIEAASEILILDLDGIGRTIILVCADMDHNHPGDWLLHVTRPEWVYAPVMDGSTCWAWDGDPLKKWIVARALRAASMARSRVVVTNSISMTHWNNAANRAAGKSCLADCGIALLIDGCGTEPIYRHELVCLANLQTPTLRAFGWLDSAKPMSRS